MKLSEWIKNKWLDNLQSGISIDAEVYLDILLPKVKQLEQQIEKMKCCCCCTYGKDIHEETPCDACDDKFKNFVIKK